MKQQTANGLCFTRCRYLKIAYFEKHKVIAGPEQGLILQKSEIKMAITLHPGSRIEHLEYGEGIVASGSSALYRIAFFGKGIIEIPASEISECKILESFQPDEDKVDVYDLRYTLKKLLEEYSDISEPVLLGERWKKGSLILQPADPNLKPKEIAVETFFHKLVMVRDRLRVLEQKINAHKLMEDSEKVEMQQYITRIYGSLTSFNVLFRYSNDQFTGEKSDN